MNERPRDAFKQMGSNTACQTAHTTLRFSTFPPRVQEREIAAVAQHCLEALHYIHTKCSTVHRDIKANNILLSADGKAMVGDFGISKVLEGDQKASTFIGSPYWMAPEVGSHP